MRVVIIGNGIAGNSAACAIREVSKGVAIIIISAERFPLYSACVLPHYLAGDIQRGKVFLTTREGYSWRDIDVILNRKVIQIDTRGSKVLLETESIPFDKLIIATGSEPIVPQIEGLTKQGVFKLKSVADADDIANFPGEKAVILGAGLVGIEAAIALRKRGYEVSMIVRSRLMRRAFDEKPSQLIRRIVEDHGIEVFTGERIQRVAGNDKVRSLVTDKREIECDMVLVAVGMRPNVELARQAGLKVGELGGIWTDRQMMTNVENIYACGDCVEAKDAITNNPTLSLFWHNAKEQGMIAGLNSIGIKRSYLGSQDITGLDVFGTHVVSIGRSMSTLEQGNVEIVEQEYKKDYRRLLIADGKVVGAQAIGKNKYVGMLLSVMRREDNINRIREARPSRKLGIFQVLASLIIADNASQSSGPLKFKPRSIEPHLL